MVATKLREVASKGKEWMYSDAEAEQQSHSWWNYATGSLSSASSTFSGMVSSLYGSNEASYNPFSSQGASAAPIITSRLEFGDDDVQTPQKRSSTRRSTGPWNQTPHSDLVWMFRNNKNPYNAVRGRDSQTTSMTAIRSLVALVPTVDEDDEEAEQLQSPASTNAVPPPYELHRTDHSFTKRPRSNVSPSETASQLAEGTIRALRDLALDEAIELQAALRYWNYRWERPLLSWLEAGPLVWYSGYSHQIIGRRVSQIQAVLARRCAAVGELQQHLLKAGWHRGVAQWGVLGQWAAVAGFDTNNSKSFGGEELRASGIFSPEPQSEHDETESGDYSPRAQVVGQEGHGTGRRVFRRSSQAAVFVGKNDGEGIFIDDPDFLAEWSVESMRLVRRILFRAGNGKVTLPCEENWTEGTDGPSLKTPTWADESFLRRLEPMPEATPFGSSELPARVAISNLPVLVNEVEELLDIMEGIMTMQRNRRLNVFRPPGWLRRNWYILSLSVPSVAFLLQKINSRSHWKHVTGLFLQKAGTFVRERLVDPLVAM